MRRKRKLFYIVQNWDDKTSIWWNRKGWRTLAISDDRKMKFLVRDEIKGVGSGGATNQKRCRNLKSALRCARKIVALNGSALITRVYFSKGKRMFQEFFLKET